MLQQNITNFLDECKHYQFSKSTISAFTTRLNELDHCLESQQVQSLDQITYRRVTMIINNHSCGTCL